MADNKQATGKPGSSDRATSKKTGGKKAAGKKTTGNKTTSKRTASKRTAAEQATTAAADGQPGKPVEAATAASSKTSAYTAGSNHPADAAVAQHTAASRDSATEAGSTDNARPAGAQRRTGGGSLVWISLLLAVLACIGIGTLLINKGLSHFSTPATSDEAMAVINEHPRLLALDRQQSRQAELLDQLQNRIEQLQQDQTEADSRQQRLQQLEAMLQEQDAAAADTDNEQTASINTLQGLQQNQTRRINELEADLAQLQAQQSDNQAEMQRQFRLLQVRQRLDEISTLLRTSRQQLLLNGNQQAALDGYDLAVQALQDLPAAEDLLPATQLGKLQQALINERSQLATVANPDLDSLIAELHGLADAVQDWPLQSDNSDSTRAASSSQGDADTGTDSGMWSKLRGSLGHLVTVRNTDKPQLGIDEQLKLKRHLQLQLRTAALLALQQRDDAWRSSLDSIDSFIRQWFVSDNRGVDAALARLRELARIELNPQWPQADEAMQLLASLQASASLQR